MHVKRHVGSVKQALRRVPPLALSHTHTRMHAHIQALQRRLPRPATVDHLPAPRPAPELARLSLRERAEDALLEEVGRLLRHDTARYPVPPSSDSKEARKVGAACVCFLF